MKFRVTFTDPNGNVFQIPELAGMTDSHLSLERHEKFYTVQEFFNGTFQAFGSNILINGGREWLKNVKRVLGSDAIITVLIEVDMKFTGAFETMYNGILAVGLFIETLEDDHLLQVTISNSLFWQKFLKRLNSKVNLQSRGDVEGNATIPMNFKPVTLTSQKINKSYVAYRKNNAIINMYNTQNPLFYFGFDEETLKEIDDQSNLSPNVSSTTGDTYPDSKQAIPLFTTIDYGQLNIDSFLLTLSRRCVDGDDPNWDATHSYQLSRNNKCRVLLFSEFGLWIQKNNETPIRFYQKLRSVPNSFIRNDGVIENLLIAYAALDAKVTDFSTPTANQVSRFNFSGNGTDGTYLEVPFTGGSGTGLKASVAVFGGNVTSVVISDPGSDYKVGDVLNAAIPGGVAQIKVTYLGSSFTINKYDTIKIYGAYLNSNTGLPYTNSVTFVEDSIFVWGQEGWQHNSGFDQMALGQNSYQKYSNVPSVNHAPSNQGGFAYGGQFVPTGSFPDEIDNDAGIGLNIKQSQWFVVSTPGYVVGGTILLEEGKCIQAKRDNPGDTLDDWTISDKTPYEGLENYALASTSFQGYYDPTNGNFPATETDGVTAPKFKDRWNIVSLQTNLQGAYVDSTFIIQALLNNPGNDRTKWWISTKEYYESYYLEDLNFQGYWDASVDLYPATINDGSAIPQDYIWIISTGGSFGGIGGVPVDVNMVIRSKVDAPGQVDGNWDVYTLDQWQLYIKQNLSLFNGAKITFETTYPDTIGQGFLLHDVGAAICDRIVGEPDMFYSPLLGNPYTKTNFAEIGNFSLFALFKGLQIRGYDLVTKPFFTSMQEFWDGINNIACLALGRYKIGGQDKIVVKTRQEAFNPTIIVKLNWVQNIKKEDSSKDQYNAVEIGNSTWESKFGGSGQGISSGLEDPQAQTTRNNLFKNIGKKLSILSDNIAASSAIEATRRVTNKQSANYEYDNNDFIIALNSTCTKPELNENFSEIDNITHSDSKYNIRLSTFRNFMRHLDFISGCLQSNLNSFWRFGSGKGNFSMKSKATSNYLGDNPGVLLAENQDQAPSNNPMYIDKIFTIEHWLDWNCYKLLRDNPDLAIGVSQTDEGHVSFFIDKLDFFFGEGKITLKAKPKTDFDIKTIIAPSGDKRYYEPAYEAQYE